jgi:hypothetical protein
MRPIHGHYSPGSFAALAILALVVFAGSWIVRNRLTRNVDDHQKMFVQKDAAYTNGRALQVIGLGYAVQSVVGFTPGNWQQHVLWALGDGLFAVCLIAIASLVVRPVFRKVHNNTDMLFGGSEKVSLTGGVFYVSLGLVIGAVLPGPGYGIVQSFSHSAVFVAVGGALMIALYAITASIKVFNLVPKVAASTDGSSTDTVYAAELTDKPRIKRSLGYAIKNGNEAATTFAATFVFGLGILTSAAAASAYSDELGSLTILVVGTLITLAIVAGVMLVVDKLIIKRVTGANNTDIPDASLKDVIEQNLVLPARVASAFMLATFLAASWLIH